MRMFSVNFMPLNYNWTLIVESAEGASKEKLRQFALIEKPMIPNKLDGKVALILPSLW